jgi:hypothetical protein
MLHNNLYKPGLLFAKPKKYKCSDESLVICWLVVWWDGSSQPLYSQKSTDTVCFEVLP